MIKRLCLFVFLLSPGWCVAQESGKDSVAAAKYLAETKTLFFSDRPAALTNALAGAEIADKLQLKTLQPTFNNIIGVIYSYQAKYELSLKYLNQALVQSKQVKDVLLTSKVYNNLGLNYRQQGNQAKAIEASIRSAKLSAQLGNIEILAGTYANISESYYSLKITTKALAYADTALKYFKQIDLKKGIANVYNTYGVIYSNKKQYVKALQYYHDALKIQAGLKDVEGQANALTNIGANYTELKQFDQAQASFMQAKKLYTQINDPKGLTEVAQNMADLKSATKDTSAITDSRLAYDFARKNTTIEQQRDIALNLSRMYRDKKDYKNSLKYLAIYDSLKNATINITVLNQVADMEAKYQTERKQQQIQLLNKQNMIQRLEINKRTTTIIVIAAVFILILLVGYQIYTRYKTQQEARLQAEVIRQQALASKGIIEAEERERKRIAGELHDGVGQLFTTVKMNLEILIERFVVKQPAASLLAEKTMAMVDESCNEVRSIAHQMMPNALIKGGLVSALRDFINKIPSEKLKLSLETKGIDKPLETTIETVLYRVIQESINNVIKHAGATSLDILLLCDEREITVSIEDNGKGFNTADKSKFTGIGLKT